MKASVIAFSTKGCETAKKVAEAFPEGAAEVYAKTSMDTLGVQKVECSMHKWTENAFAEDDVIVFVGAIGIAVREIAPFVKRKDLDPAVIGIDELGHYCVPLLSGHIGGANGYAVEIARKVGAVPVVTTATDINGKISIDAWAVTNGLDVQNLGAIKDVSSAVLSGSPVGLVSDIPVAGEVPEELSGGKDAPVGVYIGYDTSAKPFPATLRLVPRTCAVGIGCRRGTPEEAIAAAVDEAFAKIGLPKESACGFATIDLKKDEEGLISLAGRRGLPLACYTAEELKEVPGEFSSSGFVKSVTGVDCVCERSAVRLAGGGKLLLRKQAGNGVTVAVAEKEISPSFGKRRQGPQNQSNPAFRALSY